MILTIINCRSRGTCAETYHFSAAAMRLLKLVSYSIELRLESRLIATVKILVFPKENQGCKDCRLLLQVQGVELAHLCTPRC